MPRVQSMGQGQRRKVARVPQGDPRPGSVVVSYRRGVVHVPCDTGRSHRAVEPWGGEVRPGQLSRCLRALQRGAQARPHHRRSTRQTGIELVISVLFDLPAAMLPALFVVAAVSYTAWYEWII